MQKNNSLKKYLRIMLIGVAIDFAFYLIAHFAHLPLWMDTIGTSYAAMMLEPAAGLLVGFAANFYKAYFIYGNSNMVAYCLSASAALIVGIGMRKQGKINVKRIVPVILAFVIINSFLGAVVALWQGEVVSGWERYFMGLVTAIGIPDFLGLWFGGFMLKIGDGIVMAAVLLFSVKLTPKSWINETHMDVVSFKNPFFHSDNN